MTRVMSALVLVALLGAGCADAAPEPSGGGEQASPRAKAVAFAECMRSEGLDGFPDPDASGELTVDAVANDSPVDTSSPAWDTALATCKDLQPAGFTGKQRNAGEQQGALAFARCMRENGFEDFPDPSPSAPIIDTTRIPSARGRGALSIPGFTAATEKCGRVHLPTLGKR